MALLPVLVALVAALGGCWGTNSPTVVFDPSNTGGGGNGGGGGGGVLPPGGSAAPSDGALLLAGPPRLAGAAPADGATEVDVRAVVALWFSESLRRVTAGPQSVQLRRAGEPLASVSYQAIWLVGDRLLLLVPTNDLTVGTDYEVTLTSGITDLDGERYEPTEDGVVLAFRTAGQSTGVAPRVLGSFPPDGATAQPNDRAAVVVFSKSINFTGITAAVTLTNETTAQEAGYDRVAGSANRYASDRVFVFPHVDDAVDLGATVRLDVAATLTDTAFVPLPLQAPWTARFGTLGFARPAAVTPFDAMPADPFPPAVNLANFEAFPVDVQEGAGAAATDTLALRVHDQLFSTGTSAAVLVGAGTPRVNLDLADAEGDPLFLASANLVLGAYTERDGRRSTVRVAEDADGAPTTVVHDLLPPVLLTYGPPAGQFGSQFVTDLPELRPYGTASEPIALVTTRVPPGGTAANRDVFAPSASGLFVGSAFAQPSAVEGPVLFDVQLIDRAGNPSLLATPGSAVFRGFLSDQTLAASGGALRVTACDRVSLTPLAGAEVYVQDAGGGNEAFAVTGSDGSAEFTARSGAQTVTVLAPGFHAFTVHGSDAAAMSLPLSSTFALSASASTTFDGVNSGLVAVSATSLVNSASQPAPAAAADIDLDAGSFLNSVPIGLQRPGWYAAFHDIAPFPSPTYLRLLAGEERVFVDAATGSAVPSLSFAMRESLNATAGTSEHVYPLHVLPGTGFNNPVQELRVLMTTVIPGLGGQVAVGAGSMGTTNANPNAGVELELGLHADAIAEGAAAGTVQVHLYARDNDGEETIARVPVTVTASPATTTVPLPDVPTVSGAWGGSAYPYSRSFQDTLAGGPGWYRMVIRDTQAQPAEWHVWIASGSAGGGSFTLPTLAMTAGGAVGVPPLTTAPGANWRARVEAFSMPAGFGANGFFFRELYRDFLGWAIGAQGPALTF